MIPKRMLSSSGFSLIEIMVSLAIVLILSTVVGLVYSSSFSHARDSRRVSDIASIKTSLETYQMEHNGVYYHPDTETTRGVIFPQSLDNPIAYQMDFDEKIGEKHSINIVPVDPLNKRFYVYSVTPDGQQYQIVATFESPNIQTAFTFPIETAYADFPTDCSSQNKNIAYVSGDFVSKNIRTIPSLVYAFDHTKENIDIALYSNKKKAVFSKQNINLPYDAQGKVFTCSLPNVNALALIDPINALSDKIASDDTENSGGDVSLSKTSSSADDVYISYVGGNGKGYDKWNFGESRRISDTLYGNTAVNSYKIENTSESVAYFKIHAADISPGIQKTNWITLKTSTTFNARDAMDIGGDGIYNFYMDLGPECREGEKGGYQIQPHTSCLIQMYFQGDVSLSEKLGYRTDASGMVKWYIENTNKTQGNWDANTWQKNTQGDTNSTYTNPSFPIIMKGKLLDFGKNVSHVQASSDGGNDGGGSSQTTSAEQKIYFVGKAFSEGFGPILLNITVSGASVSGNAGSESAGEICFQENCGATVIRDPISGTLSGYAVGEKFGRIDMSSVIFAQDGTMSGYAPSELMGWIRF